MKLHYIGVRSPSFIGPELYLADLPIDTKERDQASTRAVRREGIERILALHKE